MSSDITFDVAEGRFNLRAGAVIVVDDRVLLVKDGGME